MKTIRDDDFEFFIEILTDTIDDNEVHKDTIKKAYKTRDRLYKLR